MARPFRRLHLVRVQAAALLPAPCPQPIPNPFTFIIYPLGLSIYHSKRVSDEGRRRKGSQFLLLAALLSPPKHVLLRLAFSTHSNMTRAYTTILHTTPSQLLHHYTDTHSYTHSWTPPTTLHQLRQVFASRQICTSSTRSHGGGGGGKGRVGVPEQEAGSLMREEAGMRPAAWRNQSHQVGS